MGARPVRPSLRWPGAEWWAPLLAGLAVIQRADVVSGLLLAAVELAGEHPSVTAVWPDGRRTTISPDPEASAEALQEELAVSGTDTGYRVPGESDPFRLKYAWLLEELGSASDAWFAYTEQPVRLLSVRVDDTGEIRVGVGRPGLGDELSVAFRLGNCEDLMGIPYAIAAQAASAGPVRVVSLRMPG
ncbi:hypothetical protein [Streptomyces hesseae]|uniref:Uncharacterized protein n=1 Tax=Streptomyces hesseae TaxID=3075519 RepID=A0ABU2STG3_9ACTN|nr:hypothetical protein [Streptomyces sp. DSM 40473]MDT0452140.1 hypothetical protein [Streptomyces sp. DSM 40473]